MNIFAIDITKKINIMIKQFLFGILFFISVSLIAQRPQLNWDTITFEKINTEILMNDIPENIWQIGTPSKSYFDTAFSVPYALVTDTLNSYPTNNYSYFDLYLSGENIGWYPYSVSVEFQHKFDTDTLKDGGFITVSYDLGLSWINIIDDNFMPGFAPLYFGDDVSLNMYGQNDSLINGNFGFSGHSNGWITSRISNFIMPVKNNIFDTDTTILRFNFISDENHTNKEGWMIDHIRLYSVDFGSDIDENIDIKNQAIAFPNPFNNQTTIKLDKKYQVVESRVYNIQGKLMQTQNDFNCDNVIINRVKLTKGVYLLNLIYDNYKSESIKIEVGD